VKARITRTTSLFPDGHFIQWTLDDARESGVYAASVYRSGGPEGPWELLAKDLVGAFAYYDKFTPPANASDAYRRPNQLRLYKNFYYRVEIKTPSGEIHVAAEEVGPLIENRKIEGERRKAARDFKTSLKYNGTPVAILKRKLWGERCKKCWDPITKEIVRAACKVCWGTSFVDGYWAPVLMHARSSVTEGGTAVTPQGTSDANQVRVWLADVPALERDDVIVFLVDQRRFRVDQIGQTEILKTAVHQTVVCQEIPHDNILYRMPVDVRALKPMV
jgi:hypothetical protein